MMMIFNKMLASRNAVIQWSCTTRATLRHQAARSSTRAVTAARRSRSRSASVKWFAAGTRVLPRWALESAPTWSARLTSPMDRPALEESFHQTLLSSSMSSFSTSRARCIASIWACSFNYYFNYFLLNWYNFSSTIYDIFNHYHIFSGFNKDY